MLGAIIGDVVGSVYEFNNVKTKDFPLYTEESRYTDDTVMTLAVAEICQKGIAFDKEQVVQTFKKWGRAYPNAGYGARFYNWVLGGETRPYNSCGNGSAMRVSACGWYGRSVEEVKALSRAVTEVTHNHEEGLLGAEVTAMCVYYARTGKDKAFIEKYVRNYYDLDFDYDELQRTYTHGAEICQVTVPQAIYCFLISTDFEDCLKTTISIGGDCDTTSAISCAIAEAYYGYIPEKMIEETFRRLPEKKGDLSAADVLTDFLAYKAVVNAEKKINKNTRFVCIEDLLPRRRNERGEVKGVNERLKWIYSDSFEDLGNYIVFEDLPTVLADFGDEANDCLKRHNVAEYISKVKENALFGDESVYAALDFEKAMKELLTVRKELDFINLLYELNGVLRKFGICKKYTFCCDLHRALVYLNGRLGDDSTVYENIFNNEYFIGDKKWIT